MTTKQPAIVVVSRLNVQSPLSLLRLLLARCDPSNIPFCKSFTPSGVPFYGFSTERVSFLMSSQSDSIVA